MKFEAWGAETGIEELVLFARNTNDIKQLLTQRLGAFGCSLFALGAWNEANLNKSEELVSNYPRAWRDFYFLRRHFLDDPIIRRLTTAYTPFLWREVQDRTNDGRFMYSEALKFGLVDGICVPLHSISGTILFALFSSEEALDLSDREFAILSTLGYSAILGYVVQARGMDNGMYAEVELTEREIECLQWAALGKSSWDIGSIIGIRASTVEYHMRKTMKKFDVSSRRFAVAKALNAGLISI